MTLGESRERMPDFDRQHPYRRGSSVDEPKPSEAGETLPIQWVDLATIPLFL